MGLYVLFIKPFIRLDCLAVTTEPSLLPRLQVTARLTAQTLGRAVGRAEGYISLRFDVRFPSIHVQWILALSRMVHFRLPPWLVRTPAWLPFIERIPGYARVEEYWLVRHFYLHKSRACTRPTPWHHTIAQFAAILDEGAL